MILFNTLRGEKENCKEEPTEEIPVDPVAFEHLTNEEIDEMTEMYEELNNTDFLSIEFNSNPVIKSVKEKLSALGVFLREKSLTAQLWFQFIDYAGIAKEFIRAEWRGDWDGRLEALRKMLNLFAATSPINYAKCGQLYLQLMTERLFHGFTSNFKIKDFIVLGEPISFGLIYGQIRLLTIMRPIKSLGGLTRERGMNKSTLDI